MNGFGDRRDLAFSQWSDSNLDEMQRLIEAGVLGDGTAKSFPPKAANNGTGQRGEFKLIDGGWRLTYYVAGN